MSRSGGIQVLTGPVFDGCFLDAGWSQRIDATLHREGEVDARETEGTEEEEAKLHGGRIA